jgi:hypothetical protein
MTLAKSSRNMLVRRHVATLASNPGAMLLLPAAPLPLLLTPPGPASKGLSPLPVRSLGREVFASDAYPTIPAAFTNSNPYLNKA